MKGHIVPVLPPPPHRPPLPARFPAAAEQSAAHQMNRLRGACRVRLFVSQYTPSMPGAAAVAVALLLCLCSVIGIAAAQQGPSACSGAWSTAALSVARLNLAATSLPNQGLAIFAGGAGL